MKLLKKSIRCALLLGLVMSCSAGAASMTADPEPSPICIIYPELCD